MCFFLTRVCEIDNFRFLTAVSVFLDISQKEPAVTVILILNGEIYVIISLYVILFIIGDSNEGPLHIWTSTKEVEGYVQCEKIALLDLSVRGYKIIDSMPLSELINISDAIQGVIMTIATIAKFKDGCKNKMKLDKFIGMMT